MKYTKNNLLDLAVVIPAYNEEQTIKAVVDDCIKALKKIKNSAIFVYDNNSYDKTAQIVNSIKNDKVVYKKCSQQGKGFVIRKAFREVDARCLIMLDGDMTYPAADIPKLYEMLLENDLDMVIGDRLSSSYFTENKRPFHNFGNTLIRKSINTLFKAEIKDILT
ncbi:MAG: glycosyltransferase family 2 protein, partial [Bifidobacteriaceae bacterium]|nr:glycosyltransferase family 2 protein [Bifidobacteriaceae bacterium]